MTGISESQIRERASDEDLQARLGATISGGYLDDLAGELLACQLVGGTTVEQDLGRPKHGDIDLLLVADASINTAAVADRLVDLWPSSIRANGNEATRAGLIASALGSDPDLGPALDPDVDLLVVDAFDRMNSDHRTSFTEILDNRSYTMATSYVQETFTARGAHLFIGSPKSGSFDDFDPFARQIDYEPELVAGVDHVYPLTAAIEPTTRPLEPATARGVIEHAKNITPTWTESAKEGLANVLTEVREVDDDTDALVPLNPGRVRETVRKFTEATAKLRLLETISEEDVARAWDSCKHSSQSVGMLLDEEEKTEEIDADNRKRESFGQ